METTAPTMQQLGQAAAAVLAIQQGRACAYTPPSAAPLSPKAAARLVGLQAQAARYRALGHPLIYFYCASSADHELVAAGLLQRVAPCPLGTAKYQLTTR